ncbi:hypothetical protein SSX86_010806 [Deinandra increscens subsp. villosa]|uniref:Membrane-associated kinase regulator 2 n=1 Tax=Deinandra increscens subsp. villosa TaxID=3103831 RepID=A0AAP0DFZ3_9ASTR
MDVFSLLKFWRNAGAGDGDLRAAGDFDSSIDDDDSFFDLVFTNSGDENDYDYGASPNVTGDSRLSFGLSSPGEVNLKNRRLNSPLDSTKTKAPQSPLRLLKLGFQNNHKSKLEKETSSEIEEVKIGAFLNRDNSLRHKLRTEKLLETDQTPSKRFSKDAVNKYLNMMKPSYVKASKRCTEKSRLSERSNTPSSSPASSVFSPRKEEKKSGGRGAVFREVRKHLGKSRSASAILQTPATKSDDSAFQQQDGIQGAILHCKRSYDSPSQDCILPRSGSAPLNNQARVSIEEEKRSSI